MRRRLAALMAATLVAGIAAVLAPAGPAHATRVCAGNGDATLGAGLLYPIGLPLVTINLQNPTGVLGQRLIVVFNNELVSTTWAFRIVTGACTDPISTAPDFRASGTLKGYCGHSTGVGTTLTAPTHKIEWNSIGGFLIFTNPGPNGTVGIANAIPNIPGGESCLHGGSLTVHTPTGTLTTTAGGPALPAAGATAFIVTGAVVKTTCVGPTIVPLTSTLLLSLTNVTVLNATVHISFPLPNIHVRLHLCAPVKL